jgi:hypothetical protein
MDGEVAGVSINGLLVLHLVAAALPVNEALPLRLVCKDLCDVIGDMVTELTSPWSFRTSASRRKASRAPWPLPTVFRLRRITKIRIGSLELAVPASWQFVDSIISACMGWKDLKIVHFFIDGPPIADNDLVLDVLKRVGDLPRLRELQLFGNHEFNPRVFPALSGANLTGLQSLTLDNVLTCDDDFTTLATAPATLWASLEELEITKNYMDDGFMEMTLSVADVLEAAAPHLTRLRQLSLEGCTITAHGALLLEKAAPFLSQLRRIYLLGIEFEPGSEVPLLHAILRESLEVLSLRWADIGSEGAQALVAAAAGLPRLQDFDLTEANIDGDEILAIVKAAIEYWPLLESLEMRNIPMDIRVATELGNTSLLTRLRSLGLAGNNMGGQGVAALLGGGAAWLGTVDDLDLSGTFLGVDFLRRRLEKEEEQELAQMLARAAPQLTALTKLGLTYSDFQLDPVTIAELRLAFPRIDHFYSLCNY